MVSDGEIPSSDDDENGPSSYAHHHRDPAAEETFTVTVRSENVDTASSDFHNGVEHEHSTTATSHFSHPTVDGEVDNRHSIKPDNAVNNNHATSIAPATNYSHADPSPNSQLEDTVEINQHRFPQSTLSVPQDEVTHASSETTKVYDATRGPPSQRILDVWSTFFKNVSQNPVQRHPRTVLQRNVFGAVLAQELDRLEQLLTENPQAARVVDEDGMTPFHVVSHDVCTFILNVKLKHESYACVGWFQAVFCGGRDAIALLADFDDHALDKPDSNGDSPLLVAIHENQRACLTCLLECGADPNFRAKDNSTALHLVSAAVCVATGTTNSH